MGFKKHGVKFLSAALLIVLSAVLFSGCAKSEEKAATTAPQQKTEMVLASTTSTQDSGLFDVLIPAFEKANPDIKVQVVDASTILFCGRWQNLRLLEWNLFGWSLTTRGA